MTKAVLPLMMEQRHGAIVNVVSLSGLHGVVGQTNYSASKGGVIAMSRFGVRILGSPFPGWTTLSMGFNLREGVSRRAATEARAVTRSSC